ncbi:MAG: TetR/AcrR family transcriptional regulator [Desulfovibrio sp.]|uniref:TetR/AcrR family transcriptional regulator n=1 Tax=Desulfovibrio sp. 7SRBS1 TaxID=3378064 RepID=UPI003B3C68E4
MEKTLSRREKERLKRREYILDVALELFSSKGYHNVTMHEIAKKSEFAIGTLYTFFKNKEELYRSLLIHKSDAFHTQVEEVLDTPGDEVEKLRNYVLTLRTIFQKNADCIRLYFAETRGSCFNPKAGLDEEMKSRHRKILQRLAAVFEQGIKSKRFRPLGEPTYLAHCLDSLCNLHLFLWLENPTDNPYPEDPDKILNILFYGLLAS